MKTQGEIPSTPLLYRGGGDKLTCMSKGQYVINFCFISVITKSWSDLSEEVNNKN